MQQLQQELPSVTGFAQQADAARLHAEEEAQNTHISTDAQVQHVTSDAQQQLVAAGHKAEVESRSAQPARDTLHAMQQQMQQQTDLLQQQLNQTCADWISLKVEFATANSQSATEQRKMRQQFETDVTNCHTQHAQTVQDVQQAHAQAMQHAQAAAAEEVAQAVTELQQVQKLHEQQATVLAEVSQQLLKCQEECARYVHTVFITACFAFIVVLSLPQRHAQAQSTTNCSLWLGQIGRQMSAVCWPLQQTHIMSNVLLLLQARVSYNRAEGRSGLSQAAASAGAQSAAG